MARKAAKIQDVAKVAGVSAATVSRALRTPGMLTEETKNAVFKAIGATGYRVNLAARNLRTQRAEAILVLVPNLSNPFFSHILSGIGEAISRTNLSILISDTTQKLSDGSRYADYFLDSRIDGMIVLDGNISLEAITPTGINSADNPVVFACEWSDSLPYPSVRSDNAKGAALAIRHLYDLGHRKIAHVTGPRDNVLTRARRSSVLSERQTLNLPARANWIIRGDFSLHSGCEAARKILAMDDRPTAVFCASDQIAFGLISTLLNAGVDVPGDISVVGFDDIEISGYYKPALTTIRQDRRKLGERAAQMLVNLLYGDSAAKDDTVEFVDVELVVRDSTAPPRR